MTKSEKLRFKPEQIETYWGPELPEYLTGKTVVVLDALAATTNITNFLIARPQTLYLANSNNILSAIKQHTEAIIIGESKDPDLKNIFHFSNVPSRLEKGHAFAKMKNKTVIYMTNNGTQVIKSVLEKGARQVLTASFNNAEAVTNYLLKKQPSSIILVPCGEKSFTNYQVAEDNIAAETLTTLLKGELVNWLEIQKRVTQNILYEYTKHYTKQGLTGNELSYDLEIMFNKINNHIVPLCILDNDSLGLIRVSNIATS